MIRFPGPWRRAVVVVAVLVIAWTGTNLASSAYAARPYGSALNADRANGKFYRTTTTTTEESSDDETTTTVEESPMTATRGNKGRNGNGRRSYPTTTTTVDESNLVFTEPEVIELTEPTTTTTAPKTTTTQPKATTTTTTKVPDSRKPSPYILLQPIEPSAAATGLDTTSSSGTITPLTPITLGPATTTTTAKPKPATTTTTAKQKTTSTSTKAVSPLAAAKTTTTTVAPPTTTTTAAPKILPPTPMPLTHKDTKQADKPNHYMWYAIGGGVVLLGAFALILRKLVSA